MALNPYFAAAQTFPLTGSENLEVRNVTVESTVYKGRSSIRVTPRPEFNQFSMKRGQLAGSGPTIAIVKGAQIHNGVIEVDVSGKPQPEAPPEARGFVGIAFRVNSDASRYECVYLRPTNGRSEDQERRNHSVQYISAPDYEYSRLRSETPGKYETYADLLPGEWTKIRMEVNGDKLRFYVNGVSQPTLIVNDLKRGDEQGGIALTVGPGTEAYFANLRVLKPSAP